MSEDAQGPRFNTAQILALFGCAAVMLWSIPGLFVNPDFGIGADATSELFLGVDMNGWHALSGFLVVVPVLLVLNNAQLLGWVQAAAGLSLYATAVWAIFSERPAGGLFYFPNPTGDVLLHLVVGSIFIAGAALAFRASDDGSGREHRVEQTGEA